MSATQRRSLRRAKAKPAPTLALTPVLTYPIAKSRDCVKVPLGKNNPQDKEIGSITLRSFKIKKLCYNKSKFINYDTILFQKIYLIEPTFFFAGSDFRWDERFAAAKPRVATPLRLPSSPRYFLLRVAWLRPCKGLCVGVALALGVRPKPTPQALASAEPRCRNCATPTLY